MTPEPPRRLGRGLDALLARREPTNEPAREPATRGGPALSNANKESDDNQRAGESALQMLSLSQIRANPYQPRKEFDPDELADLEASLRVSGLLQPITVRPAPNGQGYELIAGERRFRAATRLGWKEIPALVRPIDDKMLLTLAMVENLQRADLDPIEEADGYQRLVDEFQLTNQEVADVVGKDRSTVANALRLRQLPASVRRMVHDKQITAGHARALIPLATERAIVDLAREVVAEGMSVRDVERRIQAGRPLPAGRRKKAGGAPPTLPESASRAVVRQLEEKLRRKLQTGVSIHLTAKGKGEVCMEFFSNDDLERLLSVLGVSLDN